MNSNISISTAKTFIKNVTDYQATWKVLSDLLAMDVITDDVNSGVLKLSSKVKVGTYLGIIPKREIREIASVTELYNKWLLIDSFGYVYPTYREKTCKSFKIRKIIYSSEFTKYEDDEIFNDMLLSSAVYVNGYDQIFFYTQIGDVIKSIKPIISVSCDDNIQLSAHEIEVIDAGVNKMPPLLETMNYCIGVLKKKQFDPKVRALIIGKGYE